MLEHTLINLLSDMRLRAQVASSLAERILLTRDIALYSLAFRAVTACISAAQRIGWDLSTGHLFPVATAEGGRGHLSLSAARMTVNRQSYLRMADLPKHFTMHSFRGGGSLSKSLAGTAVDEIMKIGGWKTASVAKYYIGATSSGRVRGSKKKRGQSYADASELPLSPEFRKDFAACAGKD